MGLIDDIGKGAVAVDTAVFIYFIEENPDFLSLVTPLLVEADEGRRQLVTSSLTLLEVLVVPFRAGDLALANRYEALLTRSRGIRLIELSRHQLRAAARLRALYRIRTPDALQLAAALSGGCTTFVTNDRKLPAIPQLRVLLLRDYVTT